MKTWYDIQFAANAGITEMRVYRKFWDRWFALDAPAFVLFRLPDGTRMRINKHWIISIKHLKGENDP